MLKLIYYVPENYLEQTKKAIFDVGAGKIGNYSHCAWQTLGTGQFMPMDKAKPFFGENDQIATVAEYRVEVVLYNKDAKKVYEALKKAHPYEEMAYEFVKILTIEDIYKI